MSGLSPEPTDMCLLLIAYKTHSKFDVIIASNRDEARSRQSLCASFWADAPNVLGGKDVLRGGSWLAVAKDGRFAAVTNIYKPNKISGNSRGLLVRDFLLSDSSPAEYADSLVTRIRHFPPFNLLVGNRSELFYLSNQPAIFQRLTPGIYGFTNDLLGSSWPKVRRGTRSLAKITERSKTVRTHDLFSILSTRVKSTNDGENEWRQELIFVPFTNFGTRSSTAILIDHQGWVTFAERIFNSDSKAMNETEFRFMITRKKLVH